jgi:hypothetical protein
LPAYPAGPAWCADPGSQLLEPPLGLDNPALEPSAVLLSSSGEATGPTAAPSSPLGLRGVGPSFSTGDPVGVSFSQPSRAFNPERDTGSPPIMKRRRL